MAVSEMQTQLKTILAEMDALDAKASRTNDEEGKYKSLVAEGYDLRGQIESTAKGDELRTWLGQSAGMLSLASGQGATVHGMRPAGQTVIETRGGSVLVSSDGEALLDERMMRLLRDPEYTKAFKNYCRRGEWGMTPSLGLKVLQEGLDPSGGYTVPEDILNRIIVKEPAPTRVAGRLTTFNTSRDSVVIPRVVYATDDIYTTGMRVTWTGEVPASATTHQVTDPVYGLTRIPIYTAMMSAPLTRDLAEDSAFDIVGWLSGKFSETNVLLRENMAINGTGSGQPYGILANPNATDNPATVATGAAATYTWGGLQDITWAVPEQYEDGCVWIFNKASSGLTIAKLVDGDGRPLWTNGAQDTGLIGSSKQRQLLGYEVVYSAFMPNIGAGTYPAIFGDPKGYYLVNRIGFSIEVLREILAQTNQYLLMGRTRFGGVVAESWRMKVQVCSA